MHNSSYITVRNLELLFITELFKVFVFIYETVTLHTVLIESDKSMTCRWERQKYKFEVYSTYRYFNLLLNTNFGRTFTMKKLLQFQL